MRLCRGSGLACFVGVCQDLGLGLGSHRVTWACVVRVRDILGN